MFSKIVFKRNKKVGLKENKNVFIKNFEDIIKNGNKFTVKKLIKFMANSVQGELISKCYYNDRNYKDYISNIKHSFLIDLPFEYYKECNKSIDITKTPIISCVWNDIRIKENLKKINKYVGNSFDGKSHALNVIGIYIKPLDLVIITNGNHSVNSAIVHNEGSLIVNTEVDMSPLFEKYEFNGEDYIDLKTNKKINNQFLIKGSKPFTHTIGLLFEMGRVINKLEKV